MTSHSHDSSCHILFYFRLCPSTARSSLPPETSSFLCPLLSLSIPLPVAPQCHLSNDGRVFQLITRVTPSHMRLPVYFCTRHFDNERTVRRFKLRTVHLETTHSSSLASFATTSSRTVPSGGSRDTSYGRTMSQPPTSCGERWKTCTAPPSSWQHVD